MLDGRAIIAAGAAAMQLADGAGGGIAGAPTRVLAAHATAGFAVDGRIGAAGDGAVRDAGFTDGNGRGTDTVVVAVRLVEAGATTAAHTKVARAALAGGVAVLHNGRLLGATGHKRKGEGNEGNGRPRYVGLRGYGLGDGFHGDSSP